MTDQQPPNNNAADVCALALADLAHDSNDLTHAQLLVDRFDDPATATQVHTLLMGLAQARNTTALANVLLLRPIWPDDLIGPVYQAATRITDTDGPSDQVGFITPPASLLRILLPYVHRLPQQNASWESQLICEVFFNKDTDPADHQWMVSSFVPSITPPQKWARNILEDLWYAVVEQTGATHHHNLSRLSEDTIRGWVRGYVQQCPNQARLPTTAEYAALRSTDTSHSGLSESSAMVVVFGNILHKACHRVPDRYPVVLKAIASEPTLLAWIANSVARSYIINASGAHADPTNPLGGFRPNKLLVDLLAKLPPEYALDVATWVCAQTVGVPPEITALVDKAELTAAVHPNPSDKRPLKM